MQRGKIRMMCNPIFVAVILFLNPLGAFGWMQEEFELFDLVEEVNRNFYEVMEVSKVGFHLFNWS